MFPSWLPTSSSSTSGTEDITGKFASVNMHV